MGVVRVVTKVVIVLGEVHCGGRCDCCKWHSCLRCIAGNVVVILDVKSAAEKFEFVCDIG